MKTALRRIALKLRHHPWVSLRKALHPKYWIKFFRESVLWKTSDQTIPVTFEFSEDFAPLALPSCSRPRVSIIIPVYNQAKYTYSCLQSILANSGDVPYEVILGDDCSTDETVRFPDLVKNLKVVRHKQNLRFLRNCNRTSQKAKGEFLLFLNNDTNVQPDWLQPLVDLLDSDSKIGMTGSKLVYADGRLQEAGGIIWSDASGWNYGRLDDPSLPQYSYVKDVDYISGAALMIRADLWRRLGGFDELFTPAYFEDSDLAFQVRHAGYRVVLQPASVVVHFEGISNGTDLTSGQKQYQVANREKFVAKWRDVLATEHFPNAENVFWARDRSRSRRAILVLDHYVPTYDKDAGGRTSDGFLQILVGMGWKVVFVGDNFYRSEPYTARLQQMGVEVLYGPWYAMNFQTWFRENAQYFSAVLLQRPHITIHHIDFFRGFSFLNILYYGHDLAYLRLDEQLKFEDTLELRREREKLLSAETKIFSLSDIVLSCSHSEIPLIDALSPEKKTVFIPPYFYRPLPRTSPYAERNGLLFVGGFGHGPNVDGVLWFCQEVLPRIRGKLPSAVFRIVGSNAPETIRALSIPKSVEVLGFVSDPELEKLYATSRVVVIPLRYGGGVKGKTIEAMHFGIPTVGTAFAYQGIPELEAGELACPDAESFANQVVQTYQEEAVWNSVTNRQKAFVDRYFSWERGTEIFKSLLEQK
jgi:GT2 family glycosyltransferase